MESLNDFLVKQLEPISEADPELLANYVGALLKNEKPLDQLKVLCLEQLSEFLNEDTEKFVNTLFEALESGLVQLEDDEFYDDNDTAVDSKEAPAAAVPAAGLSVQDGSASAAVVKVESEDTKDAIGVPLVGSVPEAVGAGEVGGVGEAVGAAYESSEDDEDRNHKHRRRAAGARLERERIEDGEIRASGGGENALTKKRPLPDLDRAPRQNFGRQLQDGRRNLVPANQGLRSRDGGRSRFGLDDGGRSRFGLDGGRGGLQRRVGGAFRGDDRDRFDIDRKMMPGAAGVGGNGWAPFDRFGGPPPPFMDGQPPRVGPGAFFPGGGAGVPFRGPRGPPGAPVAWNEFGQGGGVHGEVPIGPGMPGVGPGRSAIIGRGAAGGSRPQRCPDFDNQGFCLKGDTCPLDHGADRIVLEDIQHLHSLNLPAVNQGRPIGSGGLPTGTPEGTAGARMTGVRRGMQLGMPAGKEGLPNEGAGAGELYDPDRPSWTGNGLRPTGGLARLASLKRASVDAGGGGGLGNGGPDEERKAGGAGSVWERIKPPASMGMGGLGMGMGGGYNMGPGPDDWRGDRGNGGPGTGMGLPQREDFPPSYEGGGGRGGVGMYGREWGRGRGRYGGRGGGGGGRRGGDGGGNGGGEGEEGEVADRTLCVLNLPLDAENMEMDLLNHFRLIGLVVHVSVSQSRHTGFVQFARRADAEKALAAPEAVLGNRFIEIKWASYDTQPHFDAPPSPPAAADATAGSGVPPVPGAGAAVPAVDGSPAEKPPAVWARQESSGAAAKGVPAVGGGAAAAAAAVVAATNQEIASKYAKLMELKAAEDALREKKLAEQKRFQELLKRKAERASQPARDARPPAKRPHTASDAAPDGATQRDSKTTPGAVPAEDGGRGSDAETKASFLTPPKTESPTGLGFGMRGAGGGRGRGRGRGGAAGGYPGTAWGGPFRNLKIDNRTTVLRLVPPLPPVAQDTKVLWDHFSLFGDLASIEEEPKQGREEAGTGAGSAVGGVRITFAQRRNAEAAMAEGKTIQGVAIQLAWAGPAKKAPLPPPVTPVKAPAVVATNGGMAGGVGTAGGGGGEGLKSGVESDLQLGVGQNANAVDEGSPVVEVE